MSERLTPEQRAASLRLGKRTTADAVKQIRAAVEDERNRWRKAVIYWFDDPVAAAICARATSETPTPESKNVPCGD